MTELRFNIIISYGGSKIAFSVWWKKRNAFHVMFSLQLGKYTVGNKKHVQVCLVQNNRLVLDSQ
jgi:hypothetical protein